MSFEEEIRKDIACMKRMLAVLLQGAGAKATVEQITAYFEEPPRERADPQWDDCEVLDNG